VNAQVAGHEVDFLWPARRLVVETDGAATHLTPAAFEVDRRRDAALQLAGFRVVRFTWRQVTEEPGAISATLRALAS
jgi:very-short-patch-repair endonuclease